LLPQQTIEEQLSLTHVQAITGQAGVNIAYCQSDYGVDGTFRPIIVRGSRYMTGAIALDFQLKASINCIVEQEYIAYDLEVKTYNDLINRRINQGDSTILCILLLKVLPSIQNNWIAVSEESLNLNGGCYWAYLDGDMSTNTKTVRIRIPREQLFSPESLQWMLNKISIGAWP
jgi:Domain of unknown function (DUF4365)